MLQEELKDRMNIKEFLGNWIEKQKLRKRIEDYSGPKYLQYIDDEEKRKKYEHIFELRKNDFPKVLSCKNVNNWLTCPRFMPYSKDIPMSEDERWRLDRRLKFHANVSEVVSFKYISKNIYYDYSINEILKNDEVKETLIFVDNRIKEFEEKYGKDYKIKVDRYSRVSTKKYGYVYKREYKYTIADLRVNFNDGPDLIIFNDKHCEIINYSLTLYDNPLNINEFNLYALCHFSHHHRTLDDYPITYVYYNPTTNYKNQTNEASYKTKEVNFEYVRSWYLDNILNIISAADKSGNAVCGDCCQFCKQKCELRNGSV